MTDERALLHKLVLQAEAIQELARQAREHLGSPDPDIIAVADKLLGVRTEARLALHYAADIAASR